MNKWIGMGRLTRDPEVRYTTTKENQQMAIARYTLAIDRRGKQQEGQPTADFISCVAFGRQGEFAEKYLKQGTKITVAGRIQTGSYTDKDGKKIYTTDIVIEEQEFAESKKAEGNQNTQPAPKESADEGFMNIPEGIEQDLPFK